MSAKIRLLKDNRSTVDFVRSLVQAGANAIAIHAREVGDESTQPAKWDRLEEVVKILKGTESVPIIINGDLYTRDDMVRMRLRTGADGVMLARTSLYNTSIFKKPITKTAGGDQDETEEGWEDGKYGFDSPLLEKKPAVIQSYLRYAVQYASNPKNTKYVLCEMMNNRRTPPKLALRMPQIYNGRQTIDGVCQCKTIDELCQLWNVSLSEALSGRTHGSGLAWKGDIDEWFARQVGGTEQIYDDRYFLDPNGLRKDRESRERSDTAGSKDKEKKKEVVEVIQSYLRYAVQYASNPKNTKYVLCEMMNNRRTPPKLALRMPQIYNGRQTIDGVCQCKTIDELCQLWNVSLSEALSGRTHGSGLAWKGDIDEWFARQVGGTEQIYDDRYFLDPNGLRKDRESRERSDTAGSKDKEKKKEVVERGRDDEQYREDKMTSANSIIDYDTRKKDISEYAHTKRARFE